ncbi:MAG: YggS family pyridoxal phosphate-dependent enzyme [Candidatus Omnitrophica bacterium]|nr:YggS family pyridoxal phosphate-dependent enzyme [Candidatus Omnitrophota bacterium]
MIKEKVLPVYRQIEDACRQAGRHPKEVTLVAVTKYAPLEAIQQAIDAGVTDIAENRVQEAERKFPPLLAKNPQVRSHIIGHLQSNKAKDAIRVCSVIQSVDSLKLALEIEKQAAKLNKRVDILVQVNTAEEEQKFGTGSDEALQLVEGISSLVHVRIQGFMCMAPYTEDQGIIRKTFSDLRSVRDLVKTRFAGHPQVETGILSMGMSGDYKIAIEEGSTMIRVGSAIFKEVMQNA